MIEKIIVKLDADVKNYVKKMKDADKANEQTGESSAGLSKSLGKFKVAAGVAAGAAAGLAEAAVALGAALTAMTVKSAESRRELAVQARLAKTTAGEFRALSFATSQYGINAEQIADISKDLSDKLGEFATEGTGAFQDFANVMGYTASEARETADSMQELSGREAIQFMVSEMEKAGATTNQMTRALEGMGNDLTKLIPLFANSGEEVNRLTARFEEFSKLELSDQQADELLKVKENVDLLTGALSTASGAISATFAPALNDLMESTLSIVPDATEALVDFINTFRDAEDIKGISALERQIESVSESISDLRQRQSTTGGNMRTVLQGQIDAEVARRNELRAQLDLIKQQNEAIAETPSQQRESGGVDASGKTLTAEQIAEIERKKTEALREFVQTRREIIENERADSLALLEDAAEKEIGTAESRAQRALEIEREYQSQLLSLAQEREALLKKERDDRLAAIDGSEIQIIEELNAQKLEAEQEYQDSLKALYESLPVDVERAMQQQRLDSLREFVMSRREILETEYAQELSMIEEAAELGIGTEQGRNERRLEVESEYQQRLLELKREFDLSEQEYLTEKYQNEMEMLHERHEQGLIATEDYYRKAQKIAQDYGNSVIEINEDNTSSDKTSYRDRASSIANFSNTMQRVNGAILEDNKAVKAGLIVADTAAAAMMQLSSGDPYTAFPRAAAAVVWGGVQLANALSSGRGGGSIGGVGAAGTTITNDQSDFEPEETELDITTAIEGGSTDSQRVSLDVKGSDDFLDEMAERIAARLKAG